MRRYVATTLAGLALVLFTGVGQAQTSQSRQSQYPSQQQTTRSASMQGQQQTRQGTQFYLGSGTIMQIQQKLKQDGENISQTDGRWDSQTSQALKSYQQKHQLPATGDVDLATLTALDISSCPMGQSGTQTSRSGAKTPLYVGYRTLQQVHDKLQSSGMNPGTKVAWDSQTRKAVRQFQQQQGLDSTGNLNFETLAALGVTDLSGTTEQSGQQTGQQTGQGRQQDQQTGQNQPMSQEGRSTSSQPMATNVKVPVYFSPSAVRQVQTALNDQGEKLGVDGEFGPQTSSALHQFQQGQGLDPTGQVDFETLCALNLAQNLHQVAMIGEQGANVARRNRTR